MTFDSLTRAAVDGTCVIQPVIPPGSRSTIGRASPAELVFGAGAVIYECVDTPNPEGGLGKDFSEQYPEVS